MVVMSLSTAQLLLPLVLAFAIHCSPVRVVERAVIIDNISDLRLTYDYVVIGGGTSGLTVADRLTEDPKSTSLNPQTRWSTWTDHTRYSNGSRGRARLCVRPVFLIMDVAVLAKTT